MKVFAPVNLPDSEKQTLCETLLEEFSIPVVRITNKGEMHVPCPFGIHKDQDKNPTGSINYHKLAYKCLGCQASGSLLWFVASLRHETIVEAREWFNKTTGLNGQVMELPDLLKLFDALYAEDKKEKAPIPRYSKKVLEPWMFIHPYMTDPVEDGGRGIDEETYKHFLIGYADDYRVGANKTSERIIIPHIWNKELVGWQTRRLLDDGTPKYLNSPDFPKEQTLFNYDDTFDTVVVVESPMSVIRHYPEIPNIVSTFGASVSNEQIRLLKRFSNVVLWMDNDVAGWTAVQGSGKGRYRKEGMAEKLAPFTNVLVVDNPYNADPADLDTNWVKGLIELALPYSVWQPPKELLCHICEKIVHNGKCSEVIDRGVA